MTKLQNNPEILTPEEFKNIYSSEDFRNKVSFAHKHSDKNHNFKYWATCDYPAHKVRQVTPEQIKTAQQLREKRAKEVLKKNKNNLLFVGMGCEFEAKEGFINNHRIRTEFLNAEGKIFFIEVGTARDKNNMVCIHAIDRDLQIKFDNRVCLYQNRINEENKKNRPDHAKIKSLRESKNKYLEQPYNNYKKLERNESGHFTYTNLLKLVNKNFNCNFKKLVIDNTNLSCDGVICESPKN